MHRPLAIGFLGLSLVVFGMMGANAAAPPSKIGFVDLQVTIDKTKVGQKAKREFDLAVKKREAEFKTKKDELEKSSAQLQKQAAMLKPDVLRERQGELQRKYIELQEMYVKIQGDLAKQQAMLLDSIFKKAAPHIESIAKREGYTIIFERTQSALLWGDPKTDITPEVNRQL